MNYNPRLFPIKLTGDSLHLCSAAALGQALSASGGQAVAPGGSSSKLLTLKLDCNDTLGSEGASALCAGLRTNPTLRVMIYA